MRLKGMHVCNLHTFTSDSILLSYAKAQARRSWCFPAVQQRITTRKGVG
jgi:hypothetical protein